MLIFLQRGGKRKAEAGYQFKDKPEAIAVCHKFKSKDNETCGGCLDREFESKIHLKTIKFTDYLPEEIKDQICGFDDEFYQSSTPFE